MDYLHWFPHPLALGFQPVGTLEGILQEEGVCGVGVTPICPSGSLGLRREDHSSCLIILSFSRLQNLFPSLAASGRGMGRYSH